MSANDKKPEAEEPVVVEAPSAASTAAQTRRSGLHPVNIAHLVMGMLFLAFVALWIYVAAADADWTDMRFLLPMPWIAAGVLGLSVAAVRAIRRHR